ncbi:hypothetical protein QWY86_06610 [Pedobacter aquatilis]|uniref:hypothetical protein n=1 Tax=Pedobacter aquatilis TaxID=351343 RepID=UPI0025B439FA|nr:hypothetical protein [Pedobacter aquatilis]MDN3586330.1 hypothetical protein [Pedobacter aquatilis]
MQSKIISALLSLIPFFVFSQNYKPATITTSSGNKLQVELKMENWKFNPKIFNYKTVNDAALKQLSVTNTSIVEIENELKFERAEIQKSINKVNYPDIPKFEDSSSVKEKVFLKVIYQGEKLSLYAYNDEIKNRFYIKSINGNIEELKYRVFYSANIDFKIETQHLYKDQLSNLRSALAISDPIVAQKIQSSKYNTNDILAIVKLLDGSKGTISSKADASPFSFILGVGISISKFKLSSNEVLGQSPSYSSTSPFPVIGLNYMLDYNQKSMIQFLISASRDKAFFSGIDRRSEETKKFTQTNISFASMYLYNFYNSKHLAAFFSAGLGLNVPSYKDDVVTWKSTEIPNASTVVTNDLAGFQGIGFLLPVKTGISVKNFQFGIGYTYNVAGITDSPKFEINKSSLNFSIQYIFSKKR